MPKTIAIGTQDFSVLRENDCFYVDKTAFIREWWDSRDAVTLITRPRRFGKTLNMSMLDFFFSNKHAGRGDLFQGLEIWKDERFRQLQGQYPVIFISFAGIKGGSFASVRMSIFQLLIDLYIENQYLLKGDRLSAGEKQYFDFINMDMADEVAAAALRRLSLCLYRYYGKKVLIFLDEYDTPLQDAYLKNYWDELSGFIRELFNNTFKTNPYLERAILTGITRVSKESIFSDLNNLSVVTTTTKRYENSFGFTEDEVFSALREQGLSEWQEKVKKWYDGFCFGMMKDIYNPWSITSFLKEKELKTYWANTSENTLVSRLIQTGSPDIKMAMEDLIIGKQIQTPIDEEIAFSQLDYSNTAIWSLLLAAGYLKVDEICKDTSEDEAIYYLSLTNLEVQKMYMKLIRDWFRKTGDMTGFVKSMFDGNVREMNRFMNRVALTTFSSFDTGKKPSEKQPERFYHGFVLGLLVDHTKDYIVKSNRESGFGRYDVVMEPKDPKDIAVIMEFKVFDREDGEKSLEDTARNALRQIETKKYDTDLLARNIPENHILKYGFAFEGERCMILKI